MKHGLFMLMMVLGLAAPAWSQEPPGGTSTEARVSELEGRVAEVERKVKDLDGTGLVLFLFGTLCALWAQNTGRNSWLWFFLGLLFSVITVVVLLVKNAGDRDARARPPSAPPGE